MRRLAALLVLLGMSSPAQAQSPSLIKESGKWAGYRYNENTNMICYLTSTPEKQEGNYTVRGEVTFFVTHRPTANTFDEISIELGYTVKKESKAKVAVDGAETALIAEGTRAWPESVSQDRELVSAMKRGSKMVVRGISSRGTQTADSYDLTGFSSVYEATRKACNK
jgi:invasion protein IalB